MNLNKSVIASMAIKEYVRATKRNDCLRTNLSCGFIEYAFTKEATEAEVEDIVETMRSIEVALGLPHIFFESVMNAVTRDTNLW